MGETKDQDLTVHTRKNYKNKEKKENHHHINKKENKENHHRNDKKDEKQKKIKIDPFNV